MNDELHLMKPPRRSRANAHNKLSILHYLKINGRTGTLHGGGAVGGLPSGRSGLAADHMKRRKEIDLSALGAPDELD
jgi:hypothetical protein